MESILFLIIIGILSSIFGKAKGNKKPARPKPFTPAGFEDIRTMFEEQFQDSPKPKEISAGQPALVAQSNNDMSIQKKYQQTRQESVPRRIGRQESRSNETRKPTAKADEVFDNQVDEKAIISGIIWSEILSEPRARRPHFAKKGQ